MEKTISKHTEQPWALKWPLPIFFLAKIKKEILRQSAKQPLLWERFIGDIFNLWDTNKEYIQVFIAKSISYHPTIKFTDEVSENETPFLDTTVYNRERFENDSILNARSHFKPTETFQCTHFNGCHPPGVKKAFSKETLSHF